jgi:hypothetical protein
VRLVGESSVPGNAIATGGDAGYLTRCWDGLLRLKAGRQQPTPCVIMPLQTSVASHAEAEQLILDLEKRNLSLNRGCVLGGQ